MESVSSLAPSGSLAGLRILDLSRVLAGPWCTQMLGDLGAEVIKVERPGQGDDTRHWGPPFDPNTGDAAYFQCANRNKRSLAVDFSSPMGADLLRRLAADCDVLVENFKPGTLERYGLGAQQLLAAQPRLIVCSISGFGHSGPLRERAGYDFIVQAMGGLMSVTGPENAGYKCGVAVADLFTGMHAVVGILAALRHRDRTGLGQHVDLALFDCQLSMLANLASQWLCDGEPPRRLGNAHPTIAPYETLPCADGDLVLAVGNDAQFRRCVEALGRVEWAQDPRFSSNAKRLQYRKDLHELLAGELRRNSREHWVTRFEALGVPATAVASVPEALQHPQSLARDMLGPLNPAEPDGRLTVQSPLKLSLSPVQTRYPPPRLGEHSQRLLRDLGISDAEIQALQDAGVIPPPALGMDANRRH
ncbi:MAG: CaiB/BaiF CoA transferase family protein [Inhella sp.]